MIPGTPACARTISATATARRPSMSGRNLIVCPAAGWVSAAGRTSDFVSVIDDHVNTPKPEEDRIHPESTRSVEFLRRGGTGWRTVIGTRPPIDDGCHCQARVWVDAVLSFPTVLFTPLLIVVIGYWVVVVAGGTGPDAAADVLGVPVSIPASLLIVFAWFGCLAGNELVPGWWVLPAALLFALLLTSPASRPDLDDFGSNVQPQIIKIHVRAGRCCPKY